MTIRLQPSLGLTCLLLIAVLVRTAFTEDFPRANKFPGAPPVPKGYSSELAIKAAFALGQLELVELPNEVPDSVLETKDVEYANIEGQSLRLNVYRPKNLSAPSPCLVFIHGGGWSKGKREDYLIYNLAFAQRGYVTATISYRLSSVAKFPAAVQDVKAAIRWLRAHAADYNIDPHAIAAIGGSAGGTSGLDGRSRRGLQFRRPGRKRAVFKSWCKRWLICTA